MTSTAEEFSMWEIIKTADVPGVLVGLGILCYVLILLKWHSTDDTTFDFRKALIDPPEPGSVSLSRLGQLTALVVSSAVLLYFTIKSQVQEWMFAAYMVAWAGTYIAAKFAPSSRQGGVGQSGQH